MKPVRSERDGDSDSGAAAAEDAGRLSIRVELPSGGRIGPGKVALLRQVAATGSISAAGRALGMSYRRAWDLVKDLNDSLGTPVVATSAGGAGGGGAQLTPAGRAVIDQYDAIVEDAASAVQRHLRALGRVASRDE